MTAAELTIRMTVALAAGLLLGLERELHGHPAGMRTHVLVAVGAAMFTIAGAYGFGDITKGPNIDPARIAAQVASGIGFIGAGAILRDGGSIRGLTTAATLWLAASVGVGAGAGAYTEVAIGTGIVLVTLVGLRWIRPSRFRRGEVVMLDLEYGLGTGILAPILATVKASGSRVEQIDVQDEQSQGVRHLSLQLFVPGNGRTDALLDELSAIPDLRHVRVLTEESS